MLLVRGWGFTILLDIALASIEVMATRVGDAMSEWFVEIKRVEWCGDVGESWHLEAWRTSIPFAYVSAITNISNVLLPPFWIYYRFIQESCAGYKSLWLVETTINSEWSEYFFIILLRKAIGTPCLTNTSIQTIVGPEQVETNLRPHVSHVAESLLRIFVVKSSPPRAFRILRFCAPFGVCFPFSVRKINQIMRWPRPGSPWVYVQFIVVFCAENGCRLPNPWRGPAIFEVFPNVTSWTLWKLWGPIHRMSNLLLVSIPWKCLICSFSLLEGRNI
jgi:hypothetical protein